MSPFGTMIPARAEAWKYGETFRDAFEGLQATGASQSAYEVVGALDRHGREEGELLERYRRFVDESESPAARYLVRLILEDEKRHHRVPEELLTRSPGDG